MSYIIPSSTKRLYVRGFSTFDILIYLTFVAMLMHYTRPSYEDIALRIRAQQYLQPLKVAQLQINEHLLFHNTLPDFIEPKTTESYELHWDGQEYHFQTLDTDLSLSLQPHIEQGSLSWSCENIYQNSLGAYLCRALN